jgi:hypothetical protein
MALGAPVQFLHAHVRAADGGSKTYSWNPSGGAAMVLELSASIACFQLGACIAVRSRS